MKATYRMKIEIEVTHSVNDITNVKSDREMATDICEMICDEAVMCGGVATYSIIESGVNVRRIEDAGEE